MGGGYPLGVPVALALVRSVASTTSLLSHFMLTCALIAMTPSLPRVLVCNDARQVMMNTHVVGSNFAPAPAPSPQPQRFIGYASYLCHFMLTCAKLMTRRIN